MGPNSPPVCAYEVGVFEYGVYGVCKMWNQNQLILYIICSSGSSIRSETPSSVINTIEMSLMRLCFLSFGYFLYFVYTS